MIGRIIARPYLGEPSNSIEQVIVMTMRFSPFGDTVLDSLKDDGKDVIAVGKIDDIFNGKGITDSVRTKSNMDGVDQLLKVMDKDFTGMSFTNLVDFDVLYGHRRNVEGYRDALEAFDARLPEIYDALSENDLLLLQRTMEMIPTAPGTDHTREYIPVLVYSKKFEGGKEIPQGLFADISATIADNFSVKGTGFGESFLDQLK